MRKQNSIFSDNVLFDKAIHQSGGVLRHQTGVTCDISTRVPTSRAAAMELCGVTEAQWDSGDLDALRTCMTGLPVERILDFNFPPGIVFSCHHIGTYVRMSCSSFIPLSLYLHHTFGCIRIGPLQRPKVFSCVVANPSHYLDQESSILLLPSLPLFAAAVVVVAQHFTEGYPQSWRPEASQMDDFLPNAIEELAKTRRAIPIMLGMTKNEFAYGMHCNVPHKTAR